ncbi:DUF4238 domain-containing protein [Streptomyces maoxianensis]|uniref:DUF4238 domain-containing protein n=1 Tax=Streptomyces maoxianensis TaxID=1459942 RepID=A0ABV9GB58_9ACTN
MGAAQQTSRQHLVSQVLLRQFTMPGPKSSGWQLLPFDLLNPQRRCKLKSTRSCGWAENFIAFDSMSAEELWSAIESRVSAALSAVNAGAPFADPRHPATLRDLVVLHYVRSHNYHGVHTAARLAHRNTPDEVVASRFGTSIEFARWRMNV